MGANDEPSTVSVTVRNLGGIEERTVTFERGVTILTGRNATNRTSLLQAISAALGGSYGELKSDADAGSVELTVDGRTATRSFERRNGDVVVGGDPYTDESALVDCFSCLLAANPARRAVERGDGDALRDVVMEPIDTDAVRAEIRETRRELDRLDERIEEIERRRSNLPALEERRRERSEELESVRAELEEVRAAVEDREADREPDQEADAVIEELRETRDEYESVRARLETQRDAVDSLEAELTESEQRLAALDAPEGDVEALEAEIERLQRRERELAASINDLESIVSFNEDMLDSAEDLPGGDDGVVSDLDPSSTTVECWTCGTAVDRGSIDDRLGELRSVVEERRAEREEVAADLDDRRDRLASLRETAAEREELEETITEVSEEIDRRREQIADLESREADLRDRIDRLEERADEADAADDEGIEQYRRLSELEYERGQLEEQVASLTEEIEEIEGLAEELDALEDERDERSDDLADLRTRIADVERSAVDTFNDHVETVIERLGYENVERVWIERRVADDADGPVPESTFVLHVVRSGEDGAVYEDTVDHLSESERSVIGLVVALAGYLVHDVHERVPVMALDSLEQIDADRIAALVEYFADYAPFLVVALLPEDAQALDDEFSRLSMGESVA